MHTSLQMGVFPQETQSNFITICAAAHAAKMETKMKYYRNYKAKKFKFPRRLIFVLIFALVITSLTLLLGNYLKRRLENAPIDTSEISSVETTDGNDTLDTTPAVPHDEALLDVSAGFLDLAGCTDTAEMQSRVQSLKTAGYNAFSFVATDGDGRLTYASPAAQQLSRLPGKETLISLDMLTGAVTYAGKIGLRACAVFEAKSGQVQTDCAIAEELAGAGFDELLIRGFESYEALDNESIETMLSYVRSLRERAPMDIGICLSGAVYTAAQYAPYIEKLFLETEFLAIDLTAASAEDAAAAAQRLQGSFTAYLLRAVLDGSDAENSAAVQGALLEENIHSRLYISAPPAAEDDPTAQE